MELRTEGWDVDVEEVPVEGFYAAVFDFGMDFAVEVGIKGWRAPDDEVAAIVVVEWKGEVFVGDEDEVDSVALIVGVGKDFSDADGFSGDQFLS